MIRRDLPISLRAAVSVEELSREEYYDEICFLGSFWPYSNRSFESRVVKGYKECVPVYDYGPYVMRVADFYCKQILRRLGQQHFDWVVRVMSSAETVPEQYRPMSLLASMLCTRLGARDCTQVFFRSDSRPPMRTVDKLSGAEALRNRIRYVAQDLFVRPANLGGQALLIDDIANTGASMRVYAFALKAFVGIESVVAVNLAATRFAGGKDGRGALSLDTSELESDFDLRCVFLDSCGAFHLAADCPLIKGNVSVDMRFVAERKARACPTCSSSHVRKGLGALLSLWKARL